MFHVIGVKDLAADGHGVYAGTERTLRPRFGVMAFDQL